MFTKENIARIINAALALISAICAAVCTSSCMGHIMF